MRYTTIEDIMWRLSRIPQVKNITLEEVAEFTEDLLRLINVPQSLVTETGMFEIIDYKAQLPSCIQDVLGVRLMEDNCKVALTYSANPYHTSKHNSECDNDFTYVLQGCNIITSFSEGLIEVSYKKLPVDDKGFPMLPDEESFKRALVYEIRLRYAEPLWEMGKVTDKAFNRIQQERDWYVGQASTVLKTVNYDQMDMMVKGVNRLIVDTRPRETFFKGFGKTEKIKRHD